MPRLDARLKAVAYQICCNTVLDVGSDHGYLLAALLASGRIRRGIAIENKLLPFENSRRTLAGYAAEVRLGDGLEVVEEGEADCMTICGLGGASIARVLSRHPQRVPKTLIAQPNVCTELVREWARRSGYHLVDEQFIGTNRTYTILRFEYHPGESDPAYNDMNEEVAMLLGPHLIRNQSPSFRAQLAAERAYLHSLPKMEAYCHRRLAAIDYVLSGG